ncbi:MAG: tRNA (N(6)-L-threonylcarbamoyladenosine(37)-C(2))-methylthiotransferase [Desulfurococcaceae archaeon]
MPLKVYIETYGCALNKSDEALMINSLESRGHKLVSTPDEADAIIINTCTVRLDTEYKMLSRIKQLRGLCVKSGKKLVVAGCMAKIQPYTISLIAPEASLISPQNSDKAYMAVEARDRVLLLEGRRTRDLIGVCGGRSVVPIPVQEGCLSNCNFCIARHARRELISHSIEAVFSAVKKAVESGAVEIELTGMDLGVYGIDLYRKRALPELLRRIVEGLEGNYMIRIGMINPEHLKYMLDELVDVVKNSENLFKFLHIPLQSGSDRILRLMGRKYTVDEYRSIVKEIKKKIPGVSIATDIIVGYPGEDEEDFEETLKVMRELEFERVHLAGYSIRPFTLAASMPQINTNIKKERLRKALEVVVDVGLRVRKGYLYKLVKGFITEKTNTWIARLDNYIPVVIKKSDCGKLDYGMWIQVYVDEITFFDLRGYVTWSGDPP